MVGSFGPIGVQYTAFKKPTEEELAHDFLWRIRRRLPPAGVIGVFDRSHYEDVPVVRVHELAPEAERSARYGTQRERLLARLADPDKHWKFAEGDLAERARWSAYQDSFAAMLTNCNTEHAPW